MEAIELTLAREIVEFARNHPVHLVLYTYDLGPSAVPIVVISKYEDDLTNQQFKLRIWDRYTDLLGRWTGAGCWKDFHPIFSTLHQTICYVQGLFRDVPFCDI